MTTEHSATTTRLQRGGNVPLWRQLLEDLRVRLERGELDAGFPGELELVKQYAVSRHTVREALLRLRAEGLLQATRGRRARPTAIGSGGAPPVASLLTALDAELAGDAGVVRVLDKRADGVVAVRLQLEESTPLVHLERLRFHDGVPLALDRVWIPRAVGHPLLDVDLRSTDIDQALATLGAPVARVEEQLRAIIPTSAEHHLLTVSPPSPVVCIERLTAGRLAPLAWRRTLLRTDRRPLIPTPTALAPAAAHLRDPRPRR